MSRENPFKITENDILDVFNSILVNNDVTGNLQTQARLNFLSAASSSINSASNALNALQGYGPGIQSPSYIANYDHNADPSSKPFSNLHLNSVEEEDEFLYGDSNSVDEAQISSAKEDSFTINANRHNTGWSDEEDPYSESSGTVLSKLNSRLKKNLSDCDSQNKTFETAKFQHVKREDDLIEDKVPSAEISEQKYFSHQLEPDITILSPKTEINRFPVSETSNFDKAKSKYHVAAEILKKRIVEKTSSVNSSANEKLHTFPGSETSRNFSELEYRSVPSDLKTGKPAIKKQITKSINKKHLDNIRDYITGPQRKRSHPREEFGPEKHPKYEPSRSSSPSRYSSHRSSQSSYKHKSTENDHAKYPSPYSRHRSPSYDYEKRYSKYSDSHRRYSPSPKRWSHDKSPDYRHRDRSPRSRRSRSRSPGYYSSRSKVYEKKRIRQSPKKSDYSKKKDRGKHYSSGESSFCSLSLGSSSSSSSSSSDESSDEKKKSKKPIKTTLKDNKNFDNDINLKGSDDKHLKKSDNVLSRDMSNKSNIVGNNDLLSSESVAHLVNALQPSDGNQRLIEFLEKLQQQQHQPSVGAPHTTYASPAVSDINIAPNLQMPIMSTSESYAYSAVPASAPLQYVTSEVPNFPQMMPPSVFPAPVMTAIPPAQYGPYLPMPPAPSTDSQYITNVVSKSGKVRPTTLRPVPMSDAASELTSNVHSNNSSLKKSVNSSHESTKVKVLESKSLKSSKQYFENKIKNLKEKEAERNISSSSEKNLTSSSEKNVNLSSEKNINLSSKHTGESTSEQNKNLIIEKFKRMKSERAEAINKSKSATEDLDEMRKMLDETFGKRISESEKNLYARCKTLFNLCLDTASTFNNSARRSDEDLNKFKAKLSTALQAEVSKIKLEQCKEEPVLNERYSCLDQGCHYCYDCHNQFKNIKDFLQHLKTPEHKERMEASKNDWKKDFIKEQKQETGDQKKAVLKAIKGAEFLKPLTGFYCSLCKEVILDELTTEQHVKSHQHFVNYLNFLKRNPLYERKCLFKSYIQIAVSSKQQKARDIEKQKKKEAERKKNQEFAEKKSKEILLSEQSKEVVVEELYEKESEDLPPSVSQKTANIKLNLAEKDEKKKSSKEQETKNSTKFVYIGKAPNFKKTPSQKPIRWYKREDILSKKELYSDTPDVVNTTEKTAEKSSAEVKPSDSTKKSETSSSKNDSPKTKSSSDDVHSHKGKTPVSDKKDPAVKQVVKNNSDSSKHIPLSEITLPEVSSLPSSSDANTPQPMDIDNSQDIQSKPKSEEEKDFYLLGINKEDFQPLVVPVPPPTSMVSYPNVSNTYSNVHGGSSSTSSIEHSIKSFDFSVPPPTIAPFQSNVAPLPVQNNVTPLHVYGHQNNAQNTGHYPYPTNNSQMSLYSNPTQMNMHTNYQHLPQYSTPPPVFRNPPPMLPYSNTSNMPSTHQFSNPNSMSYNNAFSSSMSQNNQSYQPSVYPIPPTNITPLSLASTSQSLVPPGSTSDTSFSNVTTKSPVASQSSKASPNLKKVKVGNLIRIVPDNAQVQTNVSSSDNKQVKLSEITTSTNDASEKSEIPTNDVKKDNENAEKKEQFDMISDAINVCDKALKTAKVVKQVKKSSCNISDSNEKEDERSSKSEVKSTVDECIKKVESKELENCNTKGKSVNISSSADNPQKTDEIIEDGAHDSESVLKQNSEKSSTECVTRENSSNEIKEKSDIEMSNVSTKIEENNVSDSCHDLNAKNEDMKLVGDADKVLEENKSSLKNDPVGSNDHTLSNVEHENNEKNPGETSLAICDTQIPTANMKIDGSTVLEKSSALDYSNKTSEIIEDSNEAVLKENIITSIDNCEKVTNKLIEENDNTSMSTAIEEKITSDSIHDINAKNENKKMLENVDVQLTSMNDSIDPSHHAVSNVNCEHKNSEKQATLEESITNEGNDSVQSNSGENDCKPMEVDDNSIQNSLIKINEKNEDFKMPNISLVVEEENISSSSSNKTNEKCDDLEMPNISALNEGGKMYDSNSDNIEKNQDFEMPNISTAIEEGNIDALCKDKNVLKENNENDNEVDEVLDGNKKLETVDLVPMLMNETCDSNHYAVSNIEMEYKNNNDSKETIENICEKKIPAESMEVDDDAVLEKCANDVCSSSTNEAAEGSVLDNDTVLKQSTVGVTNDSVLLKQEHMNVDYANEFSADVTDEAKGKEFGVNIDDHSSNSSKVTERKSGAENVVDEDEPALTSDNDDKIMLQTESESNPSPNPETYKENHLINEESQKTKSTLAENLELSELSASDESTPVENKEISEHSSSDQVFIASVDSEEISQDRHLKSHKSETDEENSDTKIEASMTSGCEESESIENIREASIQSGDQDNEALEKKAEKAAEMVTEIKEEAEVIPSNKRLSGAKDSSDTEEYEDD